MSADDQGEHRLEYCRDPLTCPTKRKGSCEEFRLHAYISMIGVTSAGEGRLTFGVSMIDP